MTDQEFMDKTYRQMYEAWEIYVEENEVKDTEKNRELYCKGYLDGVLYPLFMNHVEESENA